MDRKVPLCFINLIMCWYAKCTATVRWGTECSNVFLVVAGVRQGGVLSPTLFATLQYTWMILYTNLSNLNLAVK